MQFHVRLKFRGKQRQTEATDWRDVSRLTLRPAVAFLKQVSIFRGRAGSCIQPFWAWSGTRSRGRDHSLKPIHIDNTRTLFRLRPSKICPQYIVLFLSQSREDSFVVYYFLSREKIWYFYVKAVWFHGGAVHLESRLFSTIACSEYTPTPVVQDNFTRSDIGNVCLIFFPINSFITRYIFRSQWTEVSKQRQKQW